MSKARKGREGFDEYYGAIYKERWPSLLKALCEPPTQVARANKFYSGDAREPVGISMQIGERTVFSLEPGTRVEPHLDSQGLNDFYIMDPASIFAAAALEVQGGDRVLDLCAAPGGKSLILAENLAGSGELVANEMSDQRRGRLRAVFNGYLSSDVRSRVKVTGHDGSKWCLYEKDAYDRILVDAPCSGERHLLANPAELSLWSPARSKNLSVRQYALLVSALQVVKPGGRIVYSTCSISPLENDNVIARLMKKRKGEAQVITSSASIGEATEHGRMLLPDQESIGPIYYAILQKSVSV